MKNLMYSAYHFYWVADIAFIDRADIKAYVGPPTLQARYEILRTCLQELIRTGIVSNFLVCTTLALLKNIVESFNTLLST